MGVFDYVEVSGVSGLPDGKYQTKDTPDQYLIRYKLTGDGLLEPDYDIEDHSDPNAERGSFASIRGLTVPVYRGWTPMADYTGALNLVSDDPPWLAYTVVLVDGAVVAVRGPSVYGEAP